MVQDEKKNTDDQAEVDKKWMLVCYVNERLLLRKTRDNVEDTVLYCSSETVWPIFRYLTDWVLYHTSFLCASIEVSLSLSLSFVAPIGSLLLNADESFQNGNAAPMIPSKLSH